MPEGAERTADGQTDGWMNDRLNLQGYVQLMCAYVMIVIHLDFCSVRFERIGCFNDKKNSPRLLPSYLLNDRDKQLESFSGQLIDWENWYEHLPDFVCRCAKRALEKGWRLFGIQFWGENYIFTADYRTAKDIFYSSTIRKP